MDHFTKPEGVVEVIRTIIIDDERHAIRELEFFLKEYSDIEIIASYTNPLKAIEELKENNVQLVFLDINMPQLLGIDVGSKILDINPEIKIVFVTAYDQYALEAFELNAIDYVLKPIQRTRFEKTMQRISKSISMYNPIHCKKLIIKCFGTLKIGWEHEEPIKWRTDKTKELFAYLLMHAGVEVTKDRLIEALWSDVEVEKSIKQLHNGIYYIRKTLEEYGIDRELVSISGNYCLKIGAVYFDKQVWNELKSSAVSEMTLSRIEETYSGDYLDGVDWRWTDIDRDHYVNDFIKIQCRLANYYIQSLNYTKAEECLCKAYTKNPYEDEVSYQLIKLYAISSQRIKAIKHFEKYAQVLREELKLKPPKEILDLYNSIK
jgi:two-component SAPR family response regulator